MRRVEKIILTIVFSLALIFGYSASVVAADALPPGFLIGDDSGIEVGKDGEYFISDNNVYPGKKISKDITISNYSNQDGKFSIELLLNPDEEMRKPVVSGEVNLLDITEVILTFEGKVIYQGLINGKGVPEYETKPIDLGVLDVGETKTLNVEFVIDNNQNFQKWKDVNSLDFYWQFNAVRNVEDEINKTPTKKKTIGKLPQTGDVLQKISISLIILIVILICLIYRRKRIG